MTDTASLLTVAVSVLGLAAGPALERALDPTIGPVCMDLQSLNEVMAREVIGRAAENWGGREYSDFVPTDGVLYPTRMIYFSGGDPRSGTIEGLEINPTFPANYFSIPVEVREPSPWP